MQFLKIVLGLVVALIAGLFGLVVLWYCGYISRVVAVAASPNGRIEAVCRGRLPESTEYDLWLRKPGDVFGRRVGLVGTESMGRCRAVAWSPGGEVVATAGEGGFVDVFDGRTGKAIGFQNLPPAPDGNYPTRRIVTRLRFESPNIVIFDHCARLWHTTHQWEDYRQCGSDIVTERLALKLESPRGALGR